MADEYQQSVKDMHFRVLFKKKGMDRSEQWNYTAPTPEALLKMLDRTEDINTDTCEMLIVHGYLPDNAGTIEVICHENKDKVGDKPASERVVPITYRPIHKQSKRQRREAAVESRQETVLGEMERILQAAREGKLAEVTSNPPDEEKKWKPKGVAVIAGFDVVAYPAQCKGDE